MHRNDARCACATFFRGETREATAPGAASAGRAGVRVSFSGQSAVPRRGRCGPALLRKAPKMQLPCRRLRRPRRVLRHGPAASCSAAMASRQRGLKPVGRGMPPLPPRPPRSPRQRRLRSGTQPRPVVPRDVPEGLAKPPSCRVRCAGCRCLRAGAMAHPSIRPCRLRIRRHGQSVPTGCISPCDPRYCRIGIVWHLGVGSHELWHAAPAPDSRRLSGLPVCRSGLRPSHLRVASQARPV